VAGVFSLENSTPTLLFRYTSGTTPSGPGSTTAQLEIDNTSKAVFAQGTLALGEKWDLTVGGRYTQNKQDFRRIAGVGAGVNNVYESEEPTGRIALNFRPSDRTMYYASVARGFKAGGVNLTVGQNPFVTETNTVGELGVKTSFFDRRLQVNSAIFASKYNDAQFSALVGGLPSTANAPSVKSYGAEVEAIGDFGDWHYTAGLSLLNAEFDEAVFLQDPGTNLLTLVPAGRRMTFSPEFTFNGGVEYDLHVLGGVLTPRVQYAYVGDQYATPFPNGATATTQNSRVPAHGLWDARLSYAPTDDIDLELFVNNVGNKTYIASQLQNASSQVGGYIYGAPRTVGIRLKYKFNE
jgi:iron complex outermembrane receptor protein